MFSTRKPIWNLYVSGRILRITADHPFFIPGLGWTSAADMAAEASSDAGEQEVVYHLNPGEQAMSEQPPHGFVVFGFSAETLIETARGSVPAEQIRPDDRLWSRPVNDRGGREQELWDDDHAGDAPR